MTRAAILDKPRNRVIGEVLREVREDAGMSQGDVHRITNGRITRSALCMWEGGNRTVSVDRLMQLARLYQVPPDVLLSVIEKRCQG